METIHSSIAQRLSTDWVQRLFWPRVATRRDVELVGQQGFWICVVVSAAWIVGSFVTSRPYLDLLIALAYFLGAMGVRQRSITASILVFLCLFLDRVAALDALLLDVPGGGNPMVGVMATVLLFLNIRATFLARRWVGGAKPLLRRSLATSFRGRFLNVWPAMLWPWTQYIFYLLAALIILTSLVALFTMHAMHTV